jgi:hypothetical protein
MGRERAIDLMPPGQEQVCIIVDVSGGQHCFEPVLVSELMRAVQIRHVGLYAVHLYGPARVEHPAKPLCRA